MDDTQNSRWWGVGTLAVALLVAVAACGSEVAPSGEDPGASSTSAKPTSGAEPPNAAVAEVIEDVEFYPACGNEVLRLADGRVFYQLLPDEDITMLRLGSGTGVQVLTVERPGPGDAVGTLTIFDDGYGLFVSDSGDLEAWLTAEERTYSFVC